MENSHVLPIQELLFLLYRQRQPWSLNLASGIRPGDAPLGSRLPDRLPGSAASMARPRDCSAGTGAGTGSRRRGLAPDFLPGPTPLDFCMAPPPARGPAPSRRPRPRKPRPGPPRTGRQMLSGQWLPGGYPRPKRRRPGHSRTPSPPGFPCQHTS